VALSGGADSAVAAWAVVELASPDVVHAVYVHHGQDASDDLAEAAARVAAAIGIPFEQVDVDIPPGSSFEGRARDVRLAAVAGAAGEGEWLVTGHHADDSAETVLANLLRGAGATGLSGIPGVRDRWVRPLLDLERATIRLAAEELGLPFVDDPANADGRHRRNVIRSEVLPWLEQTLDVPVRSVINRSAQALAVDDAELDQAALEVPLGASAGAVTVPAAVLSTLPPALATRAARHALRRAHPPYAGNAADVAAVLAVATGAAARHSLSGGYEVVREGALVAVFGDGPEVAEARPLPVGAAVDFGYWTVTARSVTPGKAPVLGRSRTRISAEALEGGASVRASSEGERIGLDSGSKLVRDAMAEAGVPPRLRPAWPVVAVGGKIVWVAGARVAGWARVDAAARPAVELSIEGTGV
jgi:tRNA(Ile)-lysidine synthase